MAAIEYGIDEKGENIFAKEANRRYIYKCPYCFEEIIVRKSAHYCVDYFAHKSIRHRTPQQMICPGYTGLGQYRKIENKIDKVYITNGGIPLYLCEYAREHYQLNAYFPPISKENIDLLTIWNAKIVINDDGKEEEHSVWNIPYYRIQSLSPWIGVQCKNMQYTIDEVKYKWGWGIRGFTCDMDVFHSNYGGGFRVALHSNIVVKKEYLIILRKDNTPVINGILFYYKGLININCNIKQYKVYSFVVKKITDEAIAYIQNKGYQLIEKDDDIIPVWPPAVIQGKEVIYKKQDEQAYLYHQQCSSQKIYRIINNEPIKVLEQDNFIKSDTDNETLLIKDDDFNKLSGEIRVILTQHGKNFKNVQFIRPEVRWETENGEKKLLTNGEQALYMRENIYLEANVKNLKVCILKGNYVAISSERMLKGIRKNQKIIVSIQPFDGFVIEPRKVIDNKLSMTDNIQYFVKKLRQCSSAGVMMGNMYEDLFWYAKTNAPELYTIMMIWKIKNKIPYEAIKILYQLQEVIKNE